MLGLIVAQLEEHTARCRSACGAEFRREIVAASIVVECEALFDEPGVSGRPAGGTACRAAFVDRRGEERRRSASGPYGLVEGSGLVADLAQHAEELRQAFD